MKKRVLVVLLILSMSFTETVFALSWDNCVFELLRGTKEVVGLNAFDDYTAGDVIEVAKLTLGYWLPQGGQKHYGIAEGVKYFVDGQQVTDNYLCATVGEHKITLRKDDLVAERGFHVKPKLNGKKISQITLVNPPAQTRLRSNLDSFNPEDIVVKCSFADGEPDQLLGFNELAFYSVPRNKAVRKFDEATPIYPGYVFTVPEEKDLIIRVASESIRVPITVVSPTEGASNTQMLKEPSQLEYVVDEGFKMSDYVVRCYYPDGSFKDYSGNDIVITANGVRMYDGYKFTSAGEKKLVISFGDFRRQYTLYVKAKTEVVKTPKNWWYRVGEGFRMSEFTIRCNYEGGTFKDFSGEELSITANGVKMYEGYKFQQPGNKKLTVKYGSFAKEYTLKVVDANSPIIEIAKEPLTFNYRVGEGFRMSDYAVICKYSDGSSKEIKGEELSITANGVKMYDGYSFKQAGTKKLVVKYGDFSKQYTLNVKNAGEADEISVTIDGNLVKFDQPPIIKDGRTLVPLRAIFTQMGASIDWNQNAQTVTAKKDNNVVTMQIGNNIYKVNSSEKKLDVPAQIINSRTLIPVRAIAESFDCDVLWHGDIKLVEITRGNASSVNNPYAELARDVLYYTNEERAKHGLTALTWEDDVAKVAQKYSEYMAKNNFLAHEGIDGSTPKTRIDDGEIKYTSLGENIGMGTEHAKDIVRAWMESEGHRANILRPEYTHLGVGVARGDNGYLFWTQNFISY